jgi:hypothetical protein
MGAPDLIFELRRKGYSVRADGNYLDISPANNISPELVKQLKQSKQEILAELQQETRRGKVIAMLQTDATLNRAYNIDGDCDPDRVIVTIAVRGFATYELAIPRAKYDPWQFLELYEKHGGQSVH